MHIDTFPYNKQLKSRNNNLPPKKVVTLLLISIPTQFQGFNNINFFNSNSALPNRNIRNAAYNTTTRITTKISSTVGRVLQESSIPDSAFGQYPCCLGIVLQWQRAMLCVKLSRENNYTTSSTTFEPLQSGHFPFHL